MAKAKAEGTPQPTGLGRYQAILRKLVGVLTDMKDAKGGAIEFRTEKPGIIHAGGGKASFSDDALLANVKALVDALNKAKPSGAKGTYIKKISLSSTMGPGFKVDAGSFGA